MKTFLSAFRLFVGNLTCRDTRPFSLYTRTVTTTGSDVQSVTCPSILPLVGCFVSDKQSLAPR